MGRTLARMRARADPSVRCPPGSWDLDSPEEDIHVVHGHGDRYGKGQTEGAEEESADRQEHRRRSLWVKLSVPLGQAPEPTRASHQTLLDAPSEDFQNFYYKLEKFHFLLLFSNWICRQHPLGVDVDLNKAEPLPFSKHLSLPRDEIQGWKELRDNSRRNYNRCNSCQQIKKNSYHSLMPQ